MQQVVWCLTTVLYQCQKNILRLCFRSNILPASIALKKRFFDLRKKKTNRHFIDWRNYQLIVYEISHINHQASIVPEDYLIIVGCIIKNQGHTWLLTTTYHVYTIKAERINILASRKAAMTRPRSQLVSIDDTPYYHIVCRCVRRTFLCGYDKATNTTCYEHRRQWIEDRIRLLASLFAVEICGYAVMSNHYHVVIKLTPDVADELGKRRGIGSLAMPFLKAHF